MNENHPLQHLYNIDSGFYASSIVLQSFPYTFILLFSSFYHLITLFIEYIYFNRLICCSCSSVQYVISFLATETTRELITKPDLFEGDLSLHDNDCY